MIFIYYREKIKFVMKFNLKKKKKINRICSYWFCVLNCLIVELIIIEMIVVLKYIKLKFIYIKNYILMKFLILWVGNYV